MEWGTPTDWLAINTSDLPPYSVFHSIIHCSMSYASFVWVKCDEFQNDVNESVY